MTRFAIVGAGATGGYLGACLARSGADVVLVARGPHLAAMRERGLIVREADGSEFTARPECTDDLAGAVGSAEVVFVTLKAHSLPAVAPALGAALRTGATLVTAQNGIPWWYFQRYQGPLAGTRLETVDPGGVVADHIPIESVLGCIVYPATSLLEPGVVEHLEGTRFTLGEPDGSRSERASAVGKALAGAGLKAPVQTRIRQEIWLKLLGNATFNPVSALTRASLAQIGALPETRDLVRALMEEVDSVARGLGIEIEIGLDRRLEAGFAVGEHKTSMLQDLEAGRPLEVEALVGAVCELGERLGMELPHLHSVYALTKLLDRSR
ncbi:MAG TPA: 2-dehydropantoate 2-reductase [Candidatus Dormibacteraeota bacterium]|jgi:2-dehydropantoate 2-reductase